MFNEFSEFENPYAEQLRQSRRERRAWTIGKLCPLIAEHGQITVAQAARALGVAPNKVSMNARECPSLVRVGEVNAMVGVKTPRSDGRKSQSIRPILLTLTEQGRMCFCRGRVAV